MLLPYLPYTLKQTWWYILNTCIVCRHANSINPSSSTVNEGYTKSSRSLIRLDKHLGKARYALGTADLFNQEGHLDDVEVFAVKVVDLLEVLLLHLAAAVALSARVRGAGEEQLVDDHGVGVDFVGAELLDHALGFVEGKELGDQDGNETASRRLAFVCSRKIE